MSKAKIKVMSWKDWIFWWFNVFGALFVLISCAPPVPWRYAKMSPSFGQRFVVDRQVGLFTVTNQYGQAMAWFKMKTEMCRKMQEMNRPNPLAMGMSLGSMVVSGSSDGKMNSGGAVLGCSAWPACKEHVSQRCMAYTSIAGVGIMSFLLLLFGAISAAMGVIFMAKEEHVKKKKKKEEAQWNTALCGIFAFILPVMGTLAWVFTTESMFKGLQQTAHYPYPGAHAGIYVAAVGEFLLFWAMIAGIRRQDIYRTEEEPEEDVYAPGMAAPGMMPPPAMGGMPGAMPGYPGMPGPMPGAYAAPGGMPGQVMPPPPMYAQ
eukprot:TRINITY_DN91866_c0_g1_i1.p1 TRINITY_DN91866_c0_g1~~TRINITY_DN91866_c0_g1_i1.p1  ORF type:complete len:318 (-),score=89.40 TRINITY_DN91866_c0_g1_i1:36-989(-)